MKQSDSSISIRPDGTKARQSDRGGGYEIRSRLERRGSIFTRVLVVDAKYGWITEQQVLDSTGRLLAIAHCANHRTDPASGAHLPHRVHIELPPAQMKFQLDVGNYVVNQLPGDPVELFFRPTYEGYRLVNLAEQQPFVAQPAPGPTSIYAPQNGAQPHTASKLKYRGYGGPR